MRTLVKLTPERLAPYSEKQIIRTPILPKDIKKIFFRCDAFRRATEEGYASGLSAQEAINGAKEFILATGARAGKRADTSADFFEKCIKKFEKMNKKLV